MSMPVSIIVGGQYGSEGKGKIAYLWAKKNNAKAVVRVGGSNSGHTVYDDQNKKYIFKMLPTACILNNTMCVLPAGSYIDTQILLKEIKEVNLPAERLKIDPNAVIICDNHKYMEATVFDLQKNIGSTLSGTGAALLDRVQRNKKDQIKMAKDILELQPYISNTKEFLRQLLDHSEDIIIEGTQGYGLSNYHASCYPYATSRDTTAAAFLAETGLSPFDVKDIIMTIRTFPIRVAGDSGPLEEEIDWNILSNESGANEYFEEKTSVTKKVRRVARFNPDIVKEAIGVNKPNVIVLNHIDYLDYKNQDSATLSDIQKKFILDIEKKINHKISFCGNGTMNLITCKD